MAHAFMALGDKVFVVPDGFAGAEPQIIARHDIAESTYETVTYGKWVTEEEVVVADPAAGQLTNDHDREVIRSLTGVAERSTAFSCWRTFVKNWTENVWACCYWNVFCCCQCCGYEAWRASRKVHPGQSSVLKVLPVDGAIANRQQEMIAAVQRAMRREEFDP